MSDRLSLNIGYTESEGFQPYKYNGKELDRMHGLWLYDYGARQYDPAHGLFTSIDPLCEKYYHISPYMYCEGNPVNMVDPDGEDGVVIVENDNTLKVKANYYMLTGSVPSIYDTTGCFTSDEINYFNNQINSYLNGLNLTINTGEYSGYKVTFELNFIIGGEDAELLFKADSDRYNGVRIGNTISISDETHPLLRPREYDSIIVNIGGLTQDNWQILMNRDYLRSQRGNYYLLHEIFHTFGLVDNPSSKGIMHYPPQTPTNDDANNILKNKHLPILRLYNP